MILVDPPEAPFEIIYDADTSDTLLNIVPPAGSQRMYLNAPGDKLDGWNRKKQPGSHTVWSTRNSDYGTGVVGTVRILNDPTDQVYLTNVDGSKKGLHLLPDGISVDTTNHTITEEFTIVNDGAGTDVQVIDPLTSGWTEGYATGGTVTHANGVVTNTDSVCDASGRSVLMKSIGLGFLLGKTFIKFTIVSNTDASLYCLIVNPGSSTYKLWDGVRFSLTGNVPTTFVLPISAPVASTGSNPSSIYEQGGTFDINNISRLYIGVKVSEGATVSYSVTDVTSCNGTWAQVEVAVPDNLLNPYAETYPDSYRATCNTWSPSNNDWSTVSIFRQYTDGGLDANTGYGYFLDGSKINETYGAASDTASDGAAIYDAGIAGGTGVRGKYCTTYSPPAVQYSDTGGTPRRIAFAVLMPPTGGIAGFNQIQLKVGIYYDDDNGMYVPDLSGCGNHGAIVGGVTKLNEGGLQFDGSTGYVKFSSNAPMKQTSAFSIEARFIPGSLNSQRDIFRCGYTGSSKLGVLLYISLTNYVSFAVGNGSVLGLVQASGGYVTPGMEEHIVAVYDGINCKLYRNGVLAGTSDDAEAPVVYSSGSASLSAGNGVSEYNGTLKTFKYYNTALSADDAAALYSGSNVSGAVASFRPTPENMGSTTFEFTPQSLDHFTGLDNVGNWIAFERADKRAEVFLFSRKLPSLSVTEDENGYITNIEIGVKKGTKVARAWIRYPDFDADGNSDDVPNFIDKIVEQLQNKFAFTRKYTNEVDLSGMAVVANDFSIDLQTANPVYPVSSGSKVYDSQGNLLTPVETITTADGNLDLVEVYGESAIRVFGDENLNYGECKVWDTVTAGNTVENTWVRVYDVDHVFTGDIVIENGLIRLFQDTTIFRVYLYTGGSYVLTSSIRGVTGSAFSAFSFTSISKEKILLVSPRNSLTIVRGSRFIILGQIVYEGYAGRFAYADTIHDILFEESSNWTDLPESNGLVAILDISNGIIFVTQLLTGVGRILYNTPTFNGISMLNSVNGGSVGIIPYSQQMYWEAESFNISGSGTSVVNDASYGGGAYVSATNSTDYVTSPELPLSIGTYTVFVKCSGTGDVSGRIYVYDYDVSDNLYNNNGPEIVNGYAKFNLTITPNQVNHVKKLILRGSSTRLPKYDYVLIVPTELIEKHAKRALVNLNEVKTYKEV